MLAVGVDSTDQLVPVLVGVGVAGGDPLAQASVLAERENLGPVGARNGGCRVRRAVVDDEDVGRRQAGVQLVQNGRDVVLLVPRRDEDEGVVFRHAPDAR